MTPDPSRIDRRVATADDLEYVATLIATTVGGYTVATFGEYDDAKVRRWLTEHLGDGTWAILSVGGERLGALCTFEDAEGVALEQLFFEARWHGQGWGTALVTALLGEAHARGRPVRLRVLRVNPAHRLYRRLGFRVVAETPERWFMVADPP